MSGSWHSYPSVFNLGHKHLAELFHDDVTVEEKIDGSQFSFGKFREFNPIQDRLRIRSKNVEMLVDAPEGMFEPAVETVKKLALDLHEGWTYRSEFLSKPKHNTLAYGRVPKDNLILFDINTGEEEYLSWEDKAAEAARLGLEVVPLIFHGKVTDAEMFRALLERESVLGNVKIEGVVVKNYLRFGRDKKALMAKHVSEAFKEKHEKEWKNSNPTMGDILDQLVAEYRTPARWAKGVQHLREAGKLEHSPRDIGLLMQEIPADIENECEEEIKEKLFKYAWPRIRRGLTVGLPQWYKDELLKAQFDAGSWGTQ